MEKQIKLFLEFLQNDKKASDNTLQSYRRDIVYYNKYLESNKMNYTKVKEEDIKANFKNGILQLTFPKEVARKEDEETKYITID